MPKDPLSTLLADAKKYFRAHGRSHLPWRKTRDPYKIMISEVMLQQTQVDRVIPFYRRFLERFPNAQALAAAELQEVLIMWSGLGYNRRGKLLRDAARVIVERYGGKFPRTRQAIEGLPGIGPYTAGAIAAFAFNSREVFIETNIRSVFFHYCSSILQNPQIRDSELLPLVEVVLKRSKMEPREFYAMLMDYGSSLKRSGIRLNAKSQQYVKQSKFEGSRRQLRGYILKLLLSKPSSATRIAQETRRSLQEVHEELARMQKENMITQKKSTFSVSS